MFDANFLFELDMACQEVLSFILQKQAEVNLGDALGVPGCAKKISFQNIKLISLLPDTALTRITIG